jgi:hypothetical protein
MSDQTPDQDWPTHCPECGTEMASAVVDMDKSNADRPELRPGEMAKVDYCPNVDCPANKPEGWTRGGEAAPGSLGGDNGGA